MDMFIIKHEEEVFIIQDYFFFYLEKSNYEKRNKYFIEMNLIERKYNGYYYFLIPFQIMSRLFESSISQEATNIIGDIYLNKSHW